MVGFLLVALFVVRLVCNNFEQIQRGELAVLGAYCSSHPYKNRKLPIQI
jgi:hypothetical protein